MTKMQKVKIDYATLEGKPKRKSEKNINAALCLQGLKTKRCGKMQTGRGNSNIYINKYFKEKIRKLRISFYVLSFLKLIICFELVAMINASFVCLLCLLLD